MAVTRTKRVQRKEDGTITFYGPSAREAARWVAHIASAWATVSFVMGLLEPSWLSLLIGIELELLLYKTKALLWERNRADVAGLGALVADTITNAGGFWPLAMRLDLTPAWQMFAASFNLGSDMRGLPALIISCILGFFLAILPFSLGEDK